MRISVSPARLLLLLLSTSVGSTALLACEEASLAPSPSPSPSVDGVDAATEGVPRQSRPSPADGGAESDSTNVDAGSTSKPRVGKLDETCGSKVVVEPGGSRVAYASCATASPALVVRDVVSDTVKQVDDHAGSVSDYYGWIYPRGGDGVIYASPTGALRLAGWDGAIKATIPGLALHRFHAWRVTVGAGGVLEVPPKQEELRTGTRDARLEVASSTMPAGALRRTGAFSVTGPAEQDVILSRNLAYVASIERATSSLRLRIAANTEGATVRTVALPGRFARWASDDALGLLSENDARDGIFDDGALLQTTSDSDTTLRWLDFATGALTTLATVDKTRSFAGNVRADGTDVYFMVGAKLVRWSATAPNAAPIAVGTADASLTFWHRPVVTRDKKFVGVTTTAPGGGRGMGFFAMAGSPFSPPVAAAFGSEIVSGPSFFAATQAAGIRVRNLATNDERVHPGGHDYLGLTEAGTAYSVPVPSAAYAITKYPTTGAPQPVLALPAALGLDFAVAFAPILQDGMLAVVKQPGNAPWQLHLLP